MYRNLKRASKKVVCLFILFSKRLFKIFIRKSFSEYFYAVLVIFFLLFVVGLYALGKQLSRNPYYDGSEECLKEYEKEFSTVFPEVYKRLHFYTPEPEDKITVDFAIPCCSFADPKTLLNITAKALVIKGRYLQAYQFFETMVPEIRNLFSINPTLQAAVDNYKETLFGGDQKHKICIHTRQGDFVALGTHSKLNYTEFALDHVFDLQSSKYSGASIILLGEEKPFLEKVKYDKEKIKNVYIPKELSRGEDFSFAVSSCDTFVITAKLSTFAWWIAFLLKEGSMVFYDPPPAIAPGSYESSNLLPHWIPLPYRLKKSLIAKSFYSF